jgi:hypothetical protein
MPEGEVEISDAAAGNELVRHVFSSFAVEVT